MLTLETLEAAGYRKFVQPSETIKNAEFGMQKRIADESGTRYFITVFVYNFSQWSAQNERFKTNPLVI